MVNLNQLQTQQSTKWDIFSDWIADKVGSWGFIIVFVIIIIFWIGINGWWLSNQTFDPYPFILLNLVLSCIAALQAPIIMMSQNRQEAKDRLRSEMDYLVDQKAEIIIEQIFEELQVIKKQQQLFRLLTNAPLYEVHFSFEIKKGSKEPRDEVKD